MHKISITGKLNNPDVTAHFRFNRMQQALPNFSRKGFTLLELIVVCTLIGIMLTISVPSMRSAFFTNPLKSTARQLVGTINEVRQKAVRNHEPYHLHLSQNENRIWYEKAAQGEKDTLEDEEEQNDRKELQLPETVRLAKIWMRNGGVSPTGDTTFYVSKKGYMEQAAIQLTDEFDNSLSIQCNPFTDPMTISEDFPPKSL